MNRILIVEDESIVAMQLEEKLRHMGYTVAGSASSGQEAVEKYEKLKPDMILMDIVMPDGMDGIEAAAKIRRETDTPIIFITAYADTALVNRAKRVNPSGYILKPFHDNEVRAAIEIASFSSSMGVREGGSPYAAAENDEDRRGSRIKPNSPEAHAIKRRFEMLQPIMNERLRRLLAAAETVSLGPRSISVVSRMTGVSRRAISVGVAELNEPESLTGRIRRKGGGRKKTIDKDPTLVADLEKLIKPEKPKEKEKAVILWTCKSLRRLASDLGKIGHKTSHRMVAELLHELNYNLVGVNKTIAGGGRKDYDRQFETLNCRIQEKIAKGIPAIWLTMHDKTLADKPTVTGRPASSPENEQEIDWNKENALDLLGRGDPSELYAAAKEGFWNTATPNLASLRMAIQNLESWWNIVGRKSFANAGEIMLVIAWECSSEKLALHWKLLLQQLANDLNKTITVSFLPPGTSKWVNADNEAFWLQGSKTPQGETAGMEGIINLVGTRDGAGLAARDSIERTPSVKISKKALLKINLEADKHLGDWNYSIKPKEK